MHVDLASNAAHEAEALAWLDSPEQERWKRFLYPAPRRRFALCRAALRAILCSQLKCSNEDLVIRATEYGKPFALLRSEPADISFNVSHSGGHGSLAFAPEGRLGVDVEERTMPRDLEGLIDAVFSPDEQAEIAFTSEPDKTRVFFRLWTIKEALIKALGAGLSLDVSKLEVPVAMRRGASSSLFHFPHLPTTAWKVVDLGNEDFAAAVAYEVSPTPNMTGDMRATHPAFASKGPVK